MAPGTNLSNETRANAGVPHADLDLTDEDIGQLATGALLDNRRVAELAIPPAAHQYVHARGLGDTDQSLGVTTDLVDRHVADRAAAAQGEFTQLLDHDIFVIYDETIVGVVIHGIDQQMLVGLGDPHLLRINGAKDGNDF